MKHARPLRCGARAQAAVAGSAILMLAATARADLSIVSTVTVTGSQKSPAPQKVVTSFKGDVIRTEMDRSVSLYNARTQTVTTIDKQSKSYRTVSLKDAFAGSPGVMSRLKMSATATMEPQDEVKTIAGAPARKYVGKAVLQIGLTGMPEGAAGKTVMEIEQWASEAIPTPSLPRNTLNPLLRMSGPLTSMPGMEPLVKALAQVKGTPLSSRITVTSEQTGAASATPRPPVTMTNEVVSVSTAPLSADLFRVPAGYTQVAVRPLPTPPAALRKGGAGAPKGHSH